MSDLRIRFQTARRYICCDSGELEDGSREESDPPESVPSVGIVFEEIKRQLDDQARLWDNISDNARFVLTAASLVVAGFAAFPVSGSSSNLISGWSAVPALVLYSLLAWCSLQGFVIRSFSSSPEPAGLRGYLTEEPEFTRRRIIAAMVHTYETNQDQLKVKTCWVRRSQHLLVAEACWLVIVSIIRAWT